MLVFWFTISIAAFHELNRACWCRQKWGGRGGWI